MFLPLVVEEITLHKNKIIPAQSERRKFVEEAHNSGHSLETGTRTYDKPPKSHHLHSVPQLAYYFCEL